MKRNKMFTVIVGILAVGTLCLTSFVLAQTESAPQQQPAPQQVAARQPGGFQQRPGQMPQGQMPGRGQGNVQRPQGHMPQQGPGNAQQPQGRPQNSLMGINVKQLELTEEQKTQLQEKARDFQTATAEIRTKLQYTQQDLRAEMRKEEVDQAKIDSLWAEITALKQQIGDAQVDHFLEIKSVLTPEQLEKLQDKGSETARELRDLKEEFQDLLIAPGETDAAKLKALQAQIAEKEIELQKEKAVKMEEQREKMKEKLDSLTPEQLEKFKQARQNRGGQNRGGQRPQVRR